MSIASLAIVFIALLFVTALVMFFIFEPANSETQPIQSLVSKVRPASTNPATSPVSVPSQPVLQKQNQLASLDAFVQSQGASNSSKKKVKSSKKAKKSKNKNKTKSVQPQEAAKEISVHIAPKDRRKHWEQLLTGEEKNQHNQARKHLREGEHIAAAKLFESLGMIREAVDTYEKAGFYALGARALMRINRPHRAGMVFARAEMWTDAAKCFTTADMHEEAAKCYMQTGQFESAAKAYTSIEDFVNAAQAYAKFGAFRKASEAYSLAGDKVNATKQLKLALSSEGGMGTNWLNENELDLVENEAMRSGVSDSVFKALSGDPRLPAMVESLLKKKDFSRAKRLYQFADENARNSLIGKAVDGQLSQDDLIHFLRKVKDHVSLGYALQKLGQYAQAGFEFEQAKDWDLALSNYARAGSTQDVERIQKTKAGFDFGNVVSLQHNANDQVIGISENPRLVEMRLFKNVKSSLVGRVESIASQATLSAGEYMQSSTSGHEFVNFIVSGRIEALPLDGSSEQTLGRGDSFGHETLIGFSGGQTKYLATSNVLILQIKVSAFKSILDRDGNAAQQILKNSLLSLPEYRSKIV